MASLPESDPSFELGNHLDACRETGILTDVTLLCGKEQVPFPAHKIILSGSSQYFQNLFSSEPHRTQNGRVEIPNIGPEEMALILPILYKGKFADIADTSFLKKVIEASQFLQVNTMLSWSCQRLTERLSADNFLEIYNFAGILESDVLMPRVVSFFSQNLTAISQTEDFLEVTAQQMKKIVPQLDVDKFSVESLLKGLIRWAEVEETGANREDSLLQIVLILDLQYISTDYLNSIINQEIIRRNPHLHLLLKNEVILRMLSAVNIKEHEDEIKLVLFGKKDGQYITKTYDVIRKQWSEPQKLPFLMEEGMSAAWVDGYVYIFGGNIDGEADSTCRILKYCPSTNTVRSLRDLRTFALNPLTEVINESIYVVDQRFGSSFPNKVQRYTPSSDTCEILPDPQQGHKLPSVFAFHEGLMLFSYANRKTRFEGYDPGRNTWLFVTKKISKSPFKQKAVACGETMVFIPTVPETNKYEVYDVTSNTWVTREFKERKHKISILKSAMIKDKHLLMALTHEGLLYFYDCEFENWTEVADSGLGDGFKEMIVLCNKIDSE